MVEIWGSPKWPIQCLIPLTKPSQLIPNMSRNSRQFAKSNLAIHHSDKHPESLMECSLGWDIEHEWCCRVPSSQVLTTCDCTGALPFTVPHPGYTWSCHRLWTSVTSLKNLFQSGLVFQLHTQEDLDSSSIFLPQLSSTPVTRIHLLLSSEPLPISRPIHRPKVIPFNVIVIPKLHQGLVPALMSLGGVILHQLYHCTLLLL